MMATTTAVPAPADERKLKEALAQIASLPAGAAPSREVLYDLLDGWGPDPLAPDVTFLEEVGRSAAKTGTRILECGAGPTTVLLAAMAGRRGVTVCTLEQSSPKRERLSRVAQELGLPVHLFEGPEPSKSYGRFVWYDPPLTRLPEKLWPMPHGATPERVAPVGAPRA